MTDRTIDTTIAVINDSSGTVSSNSLVKTDRGRVDDDDLLTRGGQ